MNLGAVMDEVAAQIGTIEGLQALPYPPDSIPGTEPVAVVDYPTDIQPHETYGVGEPQRMTLPVVLVIGRAVDRETRDRVSAFVASIPAVVEAGSYTALDDATWTGTEFAEGVYNGVPGLHAVFTFNIAGQGD